MNEDAYHAARAILGGHRLNITTDQVFAQLEADALYSVRDLREARRLLDAMLIGRAVETLESAGPSTGGMVAVVRLARAVRPYLAKRQHGWLRFLLALGRQRGEGMYQLSYVRRPQSDMAQPQAILDRATNTRRAVRDMLVAGAILRRIEEARKNDTALTVTAAMAAAINAEEIVTQEEAALKAWHRFRESCEHDTYRLEQYAGPMEKYRGRWIALPDTGIGLPQLPSPQGGRPKT